MQVAVIGAGLAGMSTAVQLLEAGHQVTLLEERPFVGGKVASWQNAQGDHLEMGLHVFFGCYENFFALIEKLGIRDHFLPKAHTHVFINQGGEQTSLDFRNFGGAPFHGLKAFVTTGQISTVDKLRNGLALVPLVKGLLNYDAALADIRAQDDVTFADWFRRHGGSQGSLTRLWNPIAYALGFIDTEHISARCMLTIFQIFAVKTDASKLNFLDGAPATRLHQPLVDYITDRGGVIKTSASVREIVSTGDRVEGLLLKSGEQIQADAYVSAAAADGIQRILPAHWRKHGIFDRIFQLKSVPVATVQLRFDGWVSDVDNLMYTADADFSCFADLALTSPKDYYVKGEGSLLQLVLTPGDPFMPMANDKVAEHTLAQVRRLLPSTHKHSLLRWNVVKLARSLYLEAPGMERNRPSQTTPIPNFFLAGSYTAQDYIDSMEGAVLSGKLCAQAVLASPVAHR
ncbi:9,9'-di-cis-zeta-carotene desaturase [Candidatus Cyanaurora vandensis]|uniref:9,9'-di-cis-zeta-carotene desaturase n=1 Tax=Candidatus Cyanaurora vandensis TaxID=2714958 RepID=UPI0037C0D377